MKLLAAVLLFFIMTINSQAQTNADRYSPEDLATKTLKFDPKKAGPTKKMPFSKFKVVDARFDTSKSGFLYNSSLAATNRNGYDILKIKNGTSAGLETYLNEHYENENAGNDYGLLIVLKKFWITATPQHYDEKYQVPFDKVNSRIIMNWELYLYKDDHYLPFRRVDTTLESMETVKRLFKDDNNDSTRTTETIYSIINGLVEQFDYTKAIKVFADRRTISLQEIREAYEKRFTIPVLTAAAINKGVFINFEEFKKNQPSVIHFKEIKVSKRMRYIADSTATEIKDYWGYHNDYMKVGRYGTETIFRTGNTFVFFEKLTRISDRNYSIPSTDYTARINVRGKSYDFIWIPYQVDMETGKFY